MKLPRHTPSPGTRPQKAHLQAYTLAEVYIASFAFVWLVLAIIAMMLFGMWSYNLAATKLTATAGCRKALSMMRDDIRESSWVDTGNCDATGPNSFTLISGTNAGNAVCIYPTTNVTSYTIYYLDISTTTNNLKRYTYNSNIVTHLVTITTNMVANFVTNQQIFTVMDWQNNILVDTPQNNRVIAVTLQFSQWEFPVAHVGNMYDYYQLRTRITRRCVNQYHP
jgi:hypothetical protein